MSLNVPVVLFLFRRPDTTSQVFEVVREVRPRQLFLVADGPRTGRPEEKERCRKARAVVDGIDWKCSVSRNYSEENLGIRKRFVSGLDWVFEHVDRAIILEDDCVPGASFFAFCEALLDRYSEESHIMTISGNNFQPGARTQYSYYFSRYMHCWGWATWRSAWRQFDNSMRVWPEVRSGRWLEKMFESDSAAAYWRSLFDQVYQEEIDSWAYVWQYSIWMNGGINILPEQNLVSNTGHGEHATHTRRADQRANLPAGELRQPLDHPPCKVRHAAADKYTQRQIYEQSMIQKITSRLDSLLGILG